MREKGEKMKVVNEANIGTMRRAGCVCSSGREWTRGITGWFLCNCQCDNGTANYNANYKLAHNK